MYMLQKRGLQKCFKKDVVYVLIACFSSAEKRKILLDATNEV